MNTTSSMRSTAAFPLSGFLLPKLLRVVEDVPAMPMVHRKVMALARSERATADDLAAAISEDAGLTLRVLRVANSAAFRRAEPVRTVPQAVRAIGFRAVHAMAVAASVFAAIGRLTGHAVVPLWKHGYAAALAARRIAVRLRACEPEEAFVGALVADMGQILLHVHRPEDYRTVLERVAADPSVDLPAAERDLLGVTHQEIGYLLARRWRLPELYVQVISHHHDPDRAGELARPVAVAHLADAIATALGLGSTGDGRVRPLRLGDGGLRGLGLGAAELESICAGVLADHHDFEASYGSLAGDP